MTLCPNKSLRRYLITGVVLALLPLSGMARSDPGFSGHGHQSSSATSPRYCSVAHNIGQVELTVGNSGMVGTGYALGGNIDCWTGLVISSCEYPRASNTSYLWGAALWIGAIVGEDTLVSTAFDGTIYGGNEFHPTSQDGHGIVYRSVMDPTSPAYAGAVSEQDYVAVFADTCRLCTGVLNDPVDGRPHRPLHLQVEQSSYAWSYKETDALVLFSYNLVNIGSDHLREIYAGWFVDADIFAIQGPYSAGYSDDVSGFIASAGNPWLPADCSASIDLQLGWSADNEGDFFGMTAFIPSAFAVMPLGVTPGVDRLSFNWWHRDINGINDFGPQSRAGFRLMSSGSTGAPLGDREKYHLLKNGEIDYDQVRVASIPGDDPVWLPPPVDAYRLAEGTDTRFLISRSLPDLAPGESCHFGMAVILGGKFHTKPNGLFYLPHDPDHYLARLSFDDLVKNAVVAQYIYDNPGVDTDSDGYAGESTICQGDTAWIAGDGVPDWRAAAAPSPPVFRVDPLVGGLHVRWNGAACENARNWLSRLPTFEGYKLYLALDTGWASFALVGIYDVEDFRRYRWDTLVSDWVTAEARLTLTEAICRYAPNGCADLKWHPADYTRRNPYLMPGHPDSVFYFEAIGANASRFGLETPFTKRYPQAVRPGYTSPDQVPPDSVEVYLTEDGYLKYYEYEMSLDGLLPGQPYWVVVTAFDYGSLHPLAVPLESPKLPAALRIVTLGSDPTCCQGSVGDVDCDQDDDADLADIMALIDFLFLGGPSPCCMAEADIDQSGGQGPAKVHISLGDVAWLIDHLYISNQPLPVCLGNGAGGREESLPTQD
jgi:hypothetical protein